MKSRSKFLLTWVTSAVIIGTGPLMTEVRAQTPTSDAVRTNVWADGAPALEVGNGWWFHGYVDVGGRFFTNDPQKSGIASQGGKSLSKYNEYSDNKPGPFGNIYLSTGTNNGLYQVDVWGKNVGYDDQRYDLNASKAGEHYFNFEWDQTPHNYGTASTIYNGVGTTALTLPASLSNTLYLLSGGGNTALNQPLIQSTINTNLHQANIGIRRDTASVAYRWTPTDAWDIHVDYDHMHRFGTQVDGAVWNSASGVVSQVPRPVDDTTQNFGLNGEYAGTSPWGKKFTFKAGYKGSVYQDGSDSYTVENPFCPTGAIGTTCARGSSPSALMSMWPNNQAVGFNATVGADLPMKSRYVGAVSFNMMRQNEPFLPFTNNPAPTGGTPILPALSLNGAVNTVMSNSVLTTQITPELKSKLSYRYYDFDNQTPELLFPNWVVTDTVTAINHGGGYAPVNSISVSYTKQNAAADLNWRPSREWNLGAEYGYERYNWSRADTNITNESSGKVYADWKPWVWLTARSSYQYGSRRYDNYDYLGYVGLYQWPTVGADPQYSTAMRQFYIDNRNRNKAQFSVAIDLIHGLTVTPTFAYQDDSYLIDATEVGLTDSRKWSAGLDVAYVVSPDVLFSFTYMNEHYKQSLRATTAVNTVPLTLANTYSAEITDTVNTFIAGVNWTAIPNKLDLRLSYSVSIAKDSQPVTWGVVPAGFVQYPDVTTAWQRIDASAKYKFDKEAVQKLGWKGDIYVKLAYTWERNSVANWQNDEMQTYMAAFSSSYGYQTWLTYDNPNYNVQLIVASLALKW